MRYFRKLKRRLFVGIIPLMVLSSCGSESNKDVVSEIANGVANVITSDEAKSAADDTIDYAKSLISDEKKEEMSNAAKEAAEDIKEEIKNTAKETVKEAVGEAVDTTLDRIGIKGYTATAADENGVTLAINGQAIKIPCYSGDDYIEINNNIPLFTEDEYTTESFEYYSDLDSLGRCGMAYANICTELMPTEERQSIGQIKPTGWVQNKYEIIKDADNPAGYLFNRCHLIGFQLAGENANEKNLITGTRHFNTMDGMEQFENMVADYVRRGDDNSRHVLYRVTPVFENDNLLATGVLMEAKSIEDDSISFCVFVYNVEPGIGIDYSTGENWQE